MAQALPVVSLIGRDWYIDERLKQYRAVDGVQPWIMSYNEMDDALDAYEIQNDGQSPDGGF